MVIQLQAHHVNNKVVEPHIIASSESIREAIKAIDENRSRIIFVVEENRKLIGSIRTEILEDGLAKAKNPILK